MGNRRWKMSFILTRPCMRRTSRTQRIAKTGDQDHQSPQQDWPRPRYFTAAYFCQRSEVTALGYSALPAREEKSEGETSVEATQNQCRYFDAGAQERTAAILFV